MNQRLTTSALHTLSLTFAVLLLAGGCTSDQAVNGPAPGEQPEFQFAIVSGDTDPGATPLGRPGSPSGGGRSSNPGSDPSSSSTYGGADATTASWDNPSSTSGMAMIDGSRGGVVQAGRFTVRFSRGAFPGTEMIVVRETPGAVVECELLPEGLQFQAPVTLTIDLYGTTGDMEGATIVWLDTLAGSGNSWVDMLGVYDPNHHTVTATLQHFSTYRGALVLSGRAGW